MTRSAMAKQKEIVGLKLWSRRGAPFPFRPSRRIPSYFCAIQISLQEISNEQVEKLHEVEKSKAHFPILLLFCNNIVNELSTSKSSSNDGKLTVDENVAGKCGWREITWNCHITNYCSTIRQQSMS